MELTISNKPQLDAWIQERMDMNRDMFAIKGTAPEGATYDDGELIKHPVNIAWKDGTTGEIFAIEYEQP